MELRVVYGMGGDDVPLVRAVVRRPAPTKEAGTWPSVLANCKTGQKAGIKSGEEARNLEDLSGAEFGTQRALNKTHATVSSDANQRPVRYSPTISWRSFLQLASEQLTMALALK